MASGLCFEECSVLLILALALVVLSSFGVAALGCWAILKLILRLAEFVSVSRPQNLQAVQRRPVQRTVVEPPKRLRQLARMRQGRKAIIPIDQSTEWREHS
jgi:hypothetical protein